MTHPCISACAQKRQMGMKHVTCATCKIEKLIDAATYAFAYIDSLATDAPAAEDSKRMLQDAITFAEEN